RRLTGQGGGTAPGAQGSGGTAVVVPGRAAPRSPGRGEGGSGGGKEVARRPCRPTIVGPAPGVQPAPPRGRGAEQRQGDTLQALKEYTDPFRKLAEKPLMKSLFPGMDPYIEVFDLWEDFHDDLIAAIKGVILDALPPKYVVRTRKRSYIALVE